MSRPQNAMEIFVRLDKSNCRRCGEKTCLAFAGAVYTGQKSIDACPMLAGEASGLGGASAPATDSVDRGEDYALQLKKDLRHCDLVAAAERCGGIYQNGRLRLKILGKDFSTDQEGRIASDIHVNPWLVVPFLTYVIHGKGLVPVGEWISFREMAHGRELYPLFQKRCEDAMRQVADVYPDLFADIVELFQGMAVDRRFAADVAVVLLPLPKVPIMICYQQPDEGLASSLNLCFDRTVEANLGLDALYQLCAGLANMFIALAKRHGFLL